jgi:hypothetical protein
MPLTVPNAGEVLLLEAATGKTPATAWTLRLYTAVSPAIGSGTVAGHVTEAAGGGYAAKALTAANWTTTAGTPTASVYPKQTVTFTGALTGNPAIVGYYVTAASGTVVVIEALAAAFTPTSNGDAIEVTPQITLGSVTND